MLIVIKTLNINLNGLIYFCCNEILADMRVSCLAFSLTLNCISIGLNRWKFQLIDKDVRKSQQDIKNITLKTCLQIFEQCTMSGWQCQTKYDDSNIIFIKFQFVCLF